MSVSSQVRAAAFTVQIQALADINASDGDREREVWYLHWKKARNACTHTYTTTESSGGKTATGVNQTDLTVVIHLGLY